MSLVFLLRSLGAPEVRHGGVACPCWRAMCGPMRQTKPLARVATLFLLVVPSNTSCSSDASNADCESKTLALDDYCGDDADLCYLMIPGCEELFEPQNWMEGCGFLKETWVDGPDRQGVMISTSGEPHDSGFRSGFLVYEMTQQVTAAGCERTLVIGVEPECDEWRPLCDLSNGGAGGESNGL